MQRRQKNLVLSGEAVTTPSSNSVVDEVEGRRISSVLMTKIVRPGGEHRGNHPTTMSELSYPIAMECRDALAGEESVAGWAIEVRK